MPLRDPPRMRTRCPVVMKGCAAHGIFSLIAVWRFSICSAGIGVPCLLISYKAKHSRCPEHLHAIVRCWHNADECITTKHRNFDFAPPVAPPVNLLEHREKRANSLFLKLPGDPLLVSRLGMNRVPVRFLLYRTQ